ncbi:MAG: hypothetical protein Q7S33_05700 [Nanoarchaeota archaeon]|nr:hypothetical protein [Nanoarchaeota archaeon]
MALTDSMIGQIPQELVGRVELLITIFQAVGIFVILYIIFNIVNIIINRKRNKQIDLLVKNVEEMKKALKKK